MSISIIEISGASVLKTRPSTELADAQTNSLNDFLVGIEKRAFRMAKISTGNTEDALDIVQDAMFKLVHRYTNKSVDEWPVLFHRILKNRIFDWHRRNKVRSIIRKFTLQADTNDSSDELDTYIEGSTQVPEQQLMAQQSIASVEKALTALPARQQQAFLLRAWEEMDTKTTARIMGCSESSVKTHYSRALRRLQTLLGEQLL